MSTPNKSDTDTTPSGEEQQSDFDFEQGDHVVVRVRENKTSGSLRVKFVAKCTDISTDSLGGGTARFKLPGTMNSVSYKDYEAEFERVDAPNEVNF